MKMRFSLAAAAVAVCAAMAAAPASTAKTAAEAFAGCEERALSAPDGILAAEGRLFLVGRAASDERSGASAGFGKARLAAFGRFDDWLRDSVDWPCGATREERRIAWEALRGGCAAEAVLEGAETVCERHEGEGRWLAVLAVPESGVSAAARPGRASLAAAVESVRAATAEALPGLRLAAVPTGEGLRPSPDPSPAPATAPASAYSSAPAPAPSEAEPAGYSESGGVILNETMAAGQF